MEKVKKGRPRSKNAIRKEKVMAYLTSETFSAIKKLAFFEEKSISDYVNELIEKAVSENAEKIQAFESLQQKF